MGISSLKLGQLQYSWASLRAGGTKGDREQSRGLEKLNYGPLVKVLKPEAAINVGGCTVEDLSCAG